MSVLALLLYPYFWLQGRTSMPLIPCLNILYGTENIPAWADCLNRAWGRPWLVFDVQTVWKACVGIRRQTDTGRKGVLSTTRFDEVCASVPVWHSWGPIFNGVPSCHWSLLFPLNGDVEKQWHMGKASETLYWPTTINTHLAFTFLFPKVINEKNRSIWLLTADFPAGPCP